MNSTLKREIYPRNSTDLDNCNILAATPEAFRQALGIELRDVPKVKPSIQLDADGRKEQTYSAKEFSVLLGVGGPWCRVKYPKKIFSGNCSIISHGIHRHIN